MTRERASMFEAVAEKIERAARAASSALAEAGIPHVLIGGLAVSAYARPRTTKDVDFLVPASARAELAGKRIAGHLSGVTMRFEGVSVDLLFADEEEAFLEEELEDPDTEAGLPIITPEALVYLKLATGRRRDTNDVLELVDAGLDVDAARAYLEENAEELIEDFDQSGGGGAGALSPRSRRGGARPRGRPRRRGGGRWSRRPAW